LSYGQPPQNDAPGTSYDVECAHSQGALVLDRSSIRQSGNANHLLSLPCPADGNPWPSAAAQFPFDAGETAQPRSAARGDRGGWSPHLCRRGSTSSVAMRRTTTPGGRCASHEPLRSRVAERVRVSRNVLEDDCDAVSPLAMARQIWDDQAMAQDDPCRRRFGRSASIANADLQITR
jgi:hypothetical protein